eukprot:NODE_968_length_2839_cov_0.556569.p3 type:complete len:104 gc:universal NODE_968_length_2839_cov_0.556569:2341-2652(+)
MSGGLSMIIYFCGSWESNQKVFVYNLGNVFLISSQYPKMVKVDMKSNDDNSGVSEWINNTFMDELENISISNSTGDKSDLPINVRIVTLDDFRSIRGNCLEGF